MLPNTDPKPDDILRLATDEPIVQAVIQRWRCGYSTWEKAMMIAVLALAARNAELQDEIITRIENDPPLPRGSITGL